MAASSALTGSGRFSPFEILVIERDRPQVVDLEVGAAGELLAQRLQHRIRIGAAAQTAGHSNQADQGRSLVRRRSPLIAKAARPWQPSPQDATAIPDDAMLELRPNCECCDQDLPPDSPEARICSYECTFCRDCADKCTRRALPQLRR